jgi:hypothetical protein
MSSTEAPDQEVPRRRSRWTDVLLTVCGVFVFTVFLMVATAFNPNAGVLARLFDRHGLTMLAVEVGAILVVAIIVLTVERRDSRRRIAEREAALAPSEQVESQIPGSGVPSDPSASSIEQS